MNEDLVAGVILGITSTIGMIYLSRTLEFFIIVVLEKLDKKKRERVEKNGKYKYKPTKKNGSDPFRDV